MFTWPYFDLSQIWSLNFLFEGHWLASFWHWIWSWLFTGGIHWGMANLCWPFNWAWAILIVILVLYCLLGWIVCWAYWYVVWKLFICLFGASLWDLIVWLCIASWFVLVWLWHALVWLCVGFWHILVWIWSWLWPSLLWLGKTALVLIWGFIKLFMPGFIAAGYIEHTFINSKNWYGRNIYPLAVIAILLTLFLIPTSLLGWAVFYLGTIIAFNYLFVMDPNMKF